MVTGLLVEYEFPGGGATSREDPSGMRQFARVFERFADLIHEGPFSMVPEREVYAWFNEMEERQFDREGEPGGKEWPKWADSTKARKKPGDRLMVATGAMKDALTVDTAAAALREKTDDTIMLGIDFGRLAAQTGSDGKYPIYHQAGIDYPSGTKQRKVVDVPDDEVADFQDIVQTGLVRLWKQVRK